MPVPVSSKRTTAETGTSSVETVIDPVSRPPSPDDRVRVRLPKGGRFESIGARHAEQGVPVQLAPLRVPGIDRHGGSLGRRTIGDDDIRTQAVSDPKMRNLQNLATNRVFQVLEHARANRGPGICDTSPLPICGVIKLLEVPEGYASSSKWAMLLAASNSFGAQSRTGVRPPLALLVCGPAQKSLMPVIASANSAEGLDKSGNQLVPIP